jgi:hypothetical protein
MWTVFGGARLMQTLLSMGASGRFGRGCQPPGLDLPGFSGAGEGVHACSADSIPTKILGLRA